MAGGGTREKTKAHISGRATQTQEEARVQQLSPRSERAESQAGLQPEDQCQEGGPQHLALQGRGA